MAYADYGGITTTPYNDPGNSAEPVLDPAIAGTLTQTPLFDPYNAAPYQAMIGATNPAYQQRPPAPQENLPRPQMQAQQMPQTPQLNPVPAPIGPGYPGMQAQGMPSIQGNPMPQTMTAPANAMNPQAPPQHPPAGGIGYQSMSNQNTKANPFPRGTPFLNPSFQQQNQFYHDQMAQGAPQGYAGAPLQWHGRGRQRYATTPGQTQQPGSMGAPQLDPGVVRQLQDLKNTYQQVQQRDDLTPEVKQQALDQLNQKAARLDPHGLWNQQQSTSKVDQEAQQRFRGQLPPNAVMWMDPDGKFHVHEFKHEEDPANNPKLLWEKEKHDQDMQYKAEEARMKREQHVQDMQQKAEEMKMKREQADHDRFMSNYEKFQKAGTAKDPDTGEEDLPSHEDIMSQMNKAEAAYKDKQKVQRWTDSGLLKALPSGSPVYSAGKRAYEADDMDGYRALLQLQQMMQLDPSALTPEQRAQAADLKKKVGPYLGP